MLQMSFKYGSTGVALQFQWAWLDVNEDQKSSVDGDEEIMIYCSLDIIPEFPILPIPVMELAQIVNSAMLACPEQPRGWMRYMYNYAKHHRIIQDLMLSKDEEVKCLVLKDMNFKSDRNHFVRPAQPYTEEKFKSRRIKAMYCYIKFLKKTLDLDLSMFWVKKELSKEQYHAIVDSCDSDDRALVKALSHPELRSRVDSKIDVRQSYKRGCIYRAY